MADLRANATAVHIATRLEIKCVTGQTPEGKEIFNTLSFSNVKTDATVPSIADVGLAIQKLLKAEVISFGKRDFSILEITPAV